MKEFRCPHCSREREVPDDRIIVPCMCGEYMKFIKRKPLSNDLQKDDQFIIKEVFKRGVRKGRPQLADDLIQGLDTKIKVNLK